MKIEPGIDDKPASEQQLLLYPNPSDGRITIEMPQGNEKADDQIFTHPTSYKPNSGF